MVNQPLLWFSMVAVTIMAVTLQIRKYSNKIICNYLMLIWLAEFCQSVSFSLSWFSGSLCQWYLWHSLNNETFYCIKDQGYSKLCF